MRKITEKMANAFFAERETRSGNDEIRKTQHGYKYRLWYSDIAETTKTQLTINLSGHDTMLTRERLNGILNIFKIPYGLARIKGETCLVTKDFGVFAKLKSNSIVTFHRTDRQVLPIIV